MFSHTILCRLSYSLDLEALGNDFQHWTMPDRFDPLGVDEIVSCEVSTPNCAVTSVEGSECISVLVLLPICQKRKNPQNFDKKEQIIA